MLYTIIWIVLFLCVITIYLSFKYSKKKKLPLKRKHYYSNKLAQIEKEDYYKQIILFDSMLSNILKELWYEWWLWEQLRRKPTIIFKQLNPIWELHKLRNRIAHELWVINENLLKNSAARYKQIITEIL